MYYSNDELENFGKIHKGNNRIKSALGFSIDDELLLEDYIADNEIKRIVRLGQKIQYNTTLGYCRGETRGYSNYDNPYNSRLCHRKILSNSLLFTLKGIDDKVIRNNARRDIERLPKTIAYGPEQISPFRWFQAFVDYIYSE